MAGFVLGAIIAGRVLTPEAAGWSRRTTDDGVLLTAALTLVVAVVGGLARTRTPVGDPAGAEPPTSLVSKH